MKKRRIAIAAFLLLAVLIAGIGYAATTASLNITGNAKTTSTDIDVYFATAEITTQSSGGGATPGVAGVGVKAITLTAAGLKTAGDKVVATYTIQNDSDYAVEIATPIINCVDTTNFSVETDWGVAAKTLEKKNDSGTDDMVTVIVTVTLLTTPDTVAGLTSDFTITFHATGK